MTQSPTNKNNAPELPKFGVIDRFIGQWATEILNEKVVTLGDTNPL